MTSKFPGKPNAVGYWGSCGPWRRIEAEDIPAKVRVLLQDKLIARGEPAWLYLPVLSTDDTALRCTCVKDTSETADRPCNECYGTGYAPGYQLFLHETVFRGVTSASDYTLTNCAVDTRIKPHRILLDSAATSGTIETDDVNYDNTAGDDWEVQLDAFLRQSGNTATAEFSTDAGTTWVDVADINGVAKPINTGTLRFRITMTRALAADRSPAFEIIRARHVRSGDWNRDILRRNGLTSTGQILVLRPWIVDQSSTDTGRGTLVDWTGDRSWTAPLDLFDTSLTRDTPDCRVDDSEAGPHPFYEYAHGIKNGVRVAMTNVKWNEEFGVFTHQSFDERRTQDGEAPYRLVF